MGLPQHFSVAIFYNNVSYGSINIEVSDGDTGGLVIDNEGVTVYGAGDNGEVFRVIDEDVYQATSNLIASRTTNNKITLINNIFKKFDKIPAIHYKNKFEFIDELRSAMYKK